MCKLFLSETRIKSTRPTFLMATPSPTKLLVRWYTLNLRNININALEPAICFELNCGPNYVFTKKTSIPTLCFKAKKADELAGEL